MKKFITLFVLSLVCMPMVARQITETEALQRAKRFATNEIANNQLPKQGKVDNLLKLSYSCKEAGENLYYVFNRGENQGFVIVSGDDRAYEVLGYSNEGTFDYSNIPDNMKGWLDGYAQELKILVANPNMTTITPKVENKGYATSITPLLGKIAWGQGDPYNDLCPTKENGDKTVVGCVATAMTQVMYYNQWPPKGTGSHSYTSTTNKFALSADFNTTYDWAKMAPTYNSSSTQESKDAVAKIMYHCGVSVDMDYDITSNATSLKVPQALTKYFDYNKSMRYIQRNYYNYPEWVNLIKADINNKLVVLYRGQSSAGGHLFVFDGYDENNMFHVNWGWDGMLNGYFKLNALTPSNQGIGGSTSGFNSYQSAVIGLYKNDGTTSDSYEICTQSSLSPASMSGSRNSPIKISIKGVWNQDWKPFEGYFALGLYKDNILISTISKTKISLEPSYGFANSLSLDLQIPPDVAADNYQVSFIYSSAETENWQKANMVVGAEKYINARVTDSDITLSIPNNEAPNLSAVNFVVNGNIYAKKAMRASCVVSNIGGEFYGPVYLVLLNKTTGATIAKASENIIDILDGESTKVDFMDIFSVVAGEYNLAIADYDNKIISDKIAVTVLPEPKSQVLELTEMPSFPDNNNVPKNNMCLTAKIKNTGGYFAGQLYAFIFENTDELESIEMLNSPLSIIEEGHTATVEFKGQSNLENGKYVISIYDRVGRNFVKVNPYTLQFTLSDPSGVESITTESTVIYPNPAIDFIVIKSESVIKTVKIYNMTGRLVQTVDADIDTQKMNIDISGIAAGNYIVQVVEKNGTSVKRLIKK